IKEKGGLPYHEQEIILSLGIIVKNSSMAKIMERRSAKWTTPSDGWLKLNFNGAAKGSLGLGIIKNEIA
ncbi:hypothetical protein KI387_041491, partial [Taxus chinensis]